MPVPISTLPLNKVTLPSPSIVEPRIGWRRCPLPAPVVIVSCDWKLARHLLRLVCRQDGSSHGREAEADDEAALAELFEELPSVHAISCRHGENSREAFWMARMMRMCEPQRHR